MEIRSRQSTGNEVEPVKEVSVVDITTMRIAVSSYVEDVILSSLVTSLSQVAELVQGEQGTKEKGSISIRVDIVYPTELASGRTISTGAAAPKKNTVSNLAPCRIA